jgi:4-aminobutyrate--pyruvate transaminase
LRLLAGGAHRTLGSDTIGAFFAEPINCLWRLHRAASDLIREDPRGVEEKYDVLPIADEVICGFGRIGAIFGCEAFGIKPVMISMAKQLSAAYQPISALMING